MVSYSRMFRRPILTLTCLHEGKILISRRKEFLSGRAVWTDLPDATLLKIKLWSIFSKRRKLTHKLTF